MNNFFTELKLKKKCKLKKRKVYIKILFLFSHCYLIPPTPHLLVQAVTQCSFQGFQVITAPPPLFSPVLHQNDII